MKVQLNPPLKVCRKTLEELLDALKGKALSAGRKKTT